VSAESGSGTVDDIAADSVEALVADGRNAEPTIGATGDVAGDAGRETRADLFPTGSSLLSDDALDPDGAKELAGIVAFDLPAALDAIESLPGVAPAGTPHVGPDATGVPLLAGGSSVGPLLDPVATEYVLENPSTVLVLGDDERLLLQEQLGLGGTQNGSQGQNFDATQLPEPSAFLLLGTGAVAVLAAARRRRTHQPR
jgi:hypothetical protein